MVCTIRIKNTGTDLVDLRAPEFFIYIYGSKECIIKNTGTDLVDFPACHGSNTIGLNSLVSHLQVSL